VGFLLTNTIAGFLIPPGSLLVLLLAALALGRRRPRLAQALVLAACLALYALSIPYVSNSLLQLLEPGPADPLADKTGQAIVVLGAGTYRGAPEYGGDTVNSLALMRLRYAAHLYRSLKAPLLVSGGAPGGDYTPEAVSMKEVLEREFQVPVTWVEAASASTLENARGSFQVLNAAGIRRIYLVTHAWHMPRSRYAFESAGFDVIPAPTHFVTHAARSRATVLDFVPNASSLQYSAWFFHEVIGIGWYHLRVTTGR